MLGQTIARGKSFKRGGENNIECGDGRAWSYDSFEMMIAMLISMGDGDLVRKGV